MSHPDPSCAALHDRIRHCGTRWVNHRDQTSKTQTGCGEIHLISVKVVASSELLFIQVQMTKT